MNRLTNQPIVAVLSGQLVGQLGWIDPLFIPLVVLAPPITGAAAAARRISYAWIAVLWASVGICMAWSDWVVNREDVVFHLVLALVMPALAGFGYGTVRITSRSRRQAAN